MVENKGIEINTIAYPIKIPGIVGRLVGEEAVVILPEKGQVKVLNEVGARIWTLADGRNTIRDIINAICEEYKVPTEQAEADVLDFIRLLIDKNVLELKHKP